MNSDWRLLRMGEAFQVNPRRDVQRGSTSAFVPMDALLENARRVARIDEREFTGSGMKFQNGDTLIARITPCLENGKTAYVSGLPSGAMAHGSTEYVVVTGKPEVSNNLFAYYLARSDAFRAYAISQMEGTSGRQRVSSSAIEKYEIKLPPLPTQIAIADILGALDDKIELNRQINQTLEQMAQALFQAWFVDFEPVKAKVAALADGRDPLRAAMATLSGKTDAELDELPGAAFDTLAATAALFPEEMEESALGAVPKGWKVRALPDAIHVNPPRTLRKAAESPYLDMANVPVNSPRVAKVVTRAFGSGSKFRNGDTLLARITPCLENGKTAFVDFLGSDEVGWGSTEFIVFRPKSPLPEAFAYFLCRQSEFRTFAISNMSGTSGRQRVPNDCFANYRFAVPDQAVATAFACLTNAAMNTIKARDEESRTLATLRDSLLPKLLSGELAVTPEEQGPERRGIEKGVREGRGIERTWD